METYIDNPEIKAIRRCRPNGLTLSQAAKRMKKKRFDFENNAKLIAQWREMKRLFGCGSLSCSYMNGYRQQAKQPPTQQELNTPVGPFSGGLTYGDWKGITDPGKMLRDMLSIERS